MLFLPFDPNITLALKIRDFKYLSDYYDVRVPITDKDILLGKKAVSFKIDVGAIPKTYKPGGKMFYQLEAITERIMVTEVDRSGFLALEGYKEPPRSTYTKKITTSTILFTALIFIVI